MPMHVQARPGLWNSILQPEDAGDDVEHFEDVPDPDEAHEAEAGLVASGTRPAGPDSEVRGGSRWGVLAVWSTGR
jgi:hypothetical protein